MAALGAEEQLGRAKRVGVVAAVERVAQDQLHELGVKQRRQGAPTGTR
jgi:hypothetical protein